MPGSGGEQFGRAPPAGQAQRLGDGVLVDHRRAGALVKEGYGVPHAAVGQPREQRRALRRQGEALLFGYVAEPPGDDLRVQAAEAVALAAGKYRPRHLAQLRRGQDEHQMLRRLFQYLQQRVEGGGAQHVHLVDDVNALFHARGGKHGLLPQRADVLHAVVGGGVDLHHVEDAALVDAAAGGALAAGVAVHGVQAVDGLGQYLGAGGLARPARAHEKIGVRQPARGHLGLERFRYVFLPADLVKGARPVFAVKCLIDVAQVLPAHGAE